MLERRTATFASGIRDSDGRRHRWCHARGRGSLAPRAPEARLAIQDGCDVVELAIAGGEVSERTLAPDEACDALWSPDRSRFAIERYDAVTSTIEVVSATGNHEATLGAGSLASDSLTPMSWRPDDIALGAARVWPAVASA